MFNVGCFPVSPFPRFKFLKVKNVSRTPHSAPRPPPSALRTQLVARSTFCPSRNRRRSRAGNRPVSLS